MSLVHNIESPCAAIGSTPVRLGTELVKILLRIKPLGPLAQGLDCWQRRKQAHPRRKGETQMNIRKPVDYSAIFAALDTLMTADMTQMERYREIGRQISERPEKGAAIAVAEYLCGTYPDVPGFSPRNLRRMREFYRAYESDHTVMAEAMTIGWTQNVVILEAELTLRERAWYIRAAGKFGWSKMELHRMITANAHMKISLDMTDIEYRGGCFTMNFYIISLRNLIIPTRQFEFVSAEVKKNLNFDACLAAPNTSVIMTGHKVRPMIEASPMRSDVGRYSYDAIMRNPFLLFLIPSKEEELADNLTKETADRLYFGMQSGFSNLGFCFGMGCWLVKDSCVTANQSYWCNLFNNYSSSIYRHTDTAMSTGEIKSTEFNEQELNLALDYTHQIVALWMPEESASGFVSPHNENGTQIWDGERAVSTEGKGYSRAMIHLHRAHSTGFIPEKLDKLCCVLECLFAINKNHKQRISDITASLVGTDDITRETIRSDMRSAYSIRSDASHGDGLDYLKQYTWEQMVALCQRVDGYVRRVFRKCLADPTLNYGNTDIERIRIRAYYKSIVDTVGQN